MSASVDDEEVIVQEADDIASKLIGVLVGKFKEKEGRDPDAEEVGQLLEELTEERVAEMLGEDFVCNDDKNEEEKEGEEEEQVQEQQENTDKHAGKKEQHVAAVFTFPANSVCSAATTCSDNSSSSIRPCDDVQGDSGGNPTEESVAAMSVTTEDQAASLLTGVKNKEHVAGWRKEDDTEAGVEVDHDVIESVLKKQKVI